MERELMYEILTKHFPDFVVKKGEREINGVRKEYVSIRKDGGVAAGIYCDNVGSVDDLVMMIDRIKERYEAAAKESARIAAVISDRQYILDNIVLRFTNGEELFKEADLGVELILWLCDDRYAVMAEDNLRAAGIGVEEAVSAAVKNVGRDVKIIDVARLVAENDSDHFPLLSGTRMYAVTNKRGVYGATAILNHDVQKKIADIIGEGFMVIPSSLHEVICVNCNNTVDSVCKIIRSVNSDLDDTDILSNHPYRIENGRLAVY